MIWVAQHDCLHTGKAENPGNAPPPRLASSEVSVWHWSLGELVESDWSSAYTGSKRSWVPAVKDSSGGGSRADEHIARKKASRWCRFLSQPLISRQQQSDDECTGEGSSLLSPPKKYPFTFTHGVHLVDPRERQVYV